MAFAHSHSTVLSATQIMQNAEQVVHYLLTVIEFV